MTTIPARATTVWRLAHETGVPLEVAIFQAVAYGAWLPGGEISAEWADSLSSILHSSSPWRRAGATVMTTTDSPVGDLVVAFAERVLSHLGHPVEISDATLADRAVRASLGELDGAGFTGYADEAATWSQLARGEITLDEVVPGSG